jgi:ATP-dependent RNA helicase DHX29
MLVYGALLSCVSPTLTVAACLSYKSPFSEAARGPNGGSGSDVYAARHALAKPNAGGLAAGEQSDHLVYAEAYKRWAAAVSEAERSGGERAARDVGKRHALKHGLSLETLRHIAEMRGQYAALLRDAGFMQDSGSDRSEEKGRERHDKRQTKERFNAKAPFGWADDPRAPWNAEATSAPVAKAVLAAGLYANVAALEEEASSNDAKADKIQSKTFSGSDLARWRDAKGGIGVHASSVNAKLARRGAAGLGASIRYPSHPFLTFHEKVKTHRVFARDCTVVAPAALLLFGGEVEVKHESGRVCLDGWLWLRASAQTAAVFRRARAALDAALAARVKEASFKEARRSSKTKTGLRDDKKPARENDDGGRQVVLAVRALLNDKTV